MNICTKYAFDILVICRSYGGQRRQKTYNGQRTTPGVWHKLPTGELLSLVYFLLSKLVFWPTVHSNSISLLPFVRSAPGFLVPQFSLLTQYEG